MSVVCEKYSFRIIAEDIWECVACNKSGDLDSLKEIMKDDLFVKIEDVGKNQNHQKDLLLLVNTVGEKTLSCIRRESIFLTVCLVDLQKVS